MGVTQFLTINDLQVYIDSLPHDRSKNRYIIPKNTSIIPVYVQLCVETKNFNHVYTLQGGRRLCTIADWYVESRHIVHQYERTALADSTLTNHEYNLTFISLPKFVATKNSFSSYSIGFFINAYKILAYDL